MSPAYQILTKSRGTEKDAHRVFDRLTDAQRQSVKQTLKHDPKGTAASHWTIKKVKKDVWQCDLPHGYRMAYTIIDSPSKTVLILFAGNHDDAATFLRRVK